MVLATGTSSSSGNYSDPHTTRRWTMANKDLKALFLHQLKDVYSAEQAI